MPRPRRSNLSRHSRNARRRRKTVDKMTEEEKEIVREKGRVRTARYRAAQSQEQKEAARERARLARLICHPKSKDRRTKRDVLSAVDRSVPHSEPVDSEILRICRMCLSTDSTLEPLNSDELGDYLYQKIFDYTGIQLLPSEECPSYLCSTCKSCLDDQFMFRWRCKRNVEMVNRFRGEPYPAHLIKTETNADLPDDYMQTVLDQ